MLISLFITSGSAAQALRSYDGLTFHNPVREGLPIIQTECHRFPLSGNYESIASQRGEIDRLVLLGAAPNGPADKLKSATLYIVARDDANSDGPRLPQIRKQYAKSPQPKELIVLI